MLADFAKRIAPAAQTVSVFNPVLRTYDYYLVPRGVTLRMAPPPKGKPAFGESLEALLPSLPRASVWVGRGQAAKGRITMRRHGNGPSLGAVLAMVLDRGEP